LDAAEMLAAAEAETGLRDYGDPTLPERFAVAVDHLNDMGMDADGRFEAAQVCRWLLTSRLELIEDRNRYPIGAEVIESPMFVTGEPRSGTTLMHALMSAAVLGGDVSIPATGAGHTRRRPPYARRR
jgi:hypothetical protein